MVGKTKETKPQIPPLPPLEYCSPERAARLLGCEIEDIFHWVATGAIALYAEFSQHKLGSGFLDSVSEIEWEYTPWTREGNYFSYAGPHEYIKNFYSPRFHLYEPDDPSQEREVSISGLWRLNYDLDFTSHVLSRVNGETPCHLTAVFGMSIDSLIFKPSKTLYNVVVSDLPSHLRIRRNELLKIQKHLITGEIMKGTYNHPSPEKKSPPTDIKPNPAAEEHAATRELVLAAAIHAREQWPDECKTATAWALTLDNHSQQLFGTQKAPLSQDSMARILGSAISTGKPRRKN